MNIAHLAPSLIKFPLQEHNGRYDWMLRLARLQAAAGHVVTVYAGPGSSDESRVVWKSIEAKPGNRAEDNMVLLKTAFQNQDHDIYHSHYDSLHYLLADITNKPVVSTQHWFPNRDVAQAARANTKKNVLAVPPTHFMYEEDKKLNIPSTKPISHGIDLELFRPNGQPPGNRLIFVGRISPQKGVLEAIKFAKATNQMLDIVGMIKNKDKNYWHQVEPLIDGEQIKYLGPKTQPEIARLFSQAKAFIFPSQIVEAFGLATVEAQACGTPVIICDIGASNEVVKQGKTGFVVGSDSEFIEAINNIGVIKREDCREFAQQFGINIMVDKYYRLYQSLARSN